MSGEGGDGRERTGDALRGNDGQQFDRLPATAADREVEGRATREAVVDFWHERYGVPRSTFDRFGFWEKGAGKVWAFDEGIDPDEGERVPAPAELEALGMTCLRTRQEHWKPTTDAAQKFGRRATRNVIELDAERATRFFAGEDQQLDWDGDWGYLIVAHEVRGDPEPLGVGLYLHGELRSVVPKGRRRSL
jgi:NOL1/NOP2/fmu family ribosome biogenesis protein